MAVEGVAEEWRDTKYFGYRVSNLGRVESSRVACGTKKAILVVRCHLDRAAVNFTVSGRVKHVAVGRLVLTAFVGPQPEGLECCHDDGDIFNNQLSNLRWDTHESNMADRERHGRCRRGEQSPRAKLTEQDVLAAIEMFKQPLTVTEIAKRLGHPRHRIAKVASGHTWRHLTGGKNRYGEEVPLL